MPRSSKGEIESVTLPADRACFKHKILVDEELGTVPMVLQVLTRSRRKAASESDIAQVSNFESFDYKTLLATDPVFEESPEASGVSKNAILESSVNRQMAHTISGLADQMIQALLAVSLHDDFYQGICRAVKNRVLNKNLPTGIKAEIPEDTWHKLSIFNFRNLKTLVEHEETKNQGLKISKIFFTATRKGKKNISVMTKSLILVDNARLFIPKQARPEILRRFFTFDILVYNKKEVQS